MVAVRNFKIGNTPNFRSNFPFTSGSTDLVVHGVYFDRRSRASHSNLTVVFISVLRKYRNFIQGCEIDGILVNKKEVVDIAISWFIDHFFPVTHRDCFLYCFDTEIKVNSSVSVLYRKNGKTVKEPALSNSVVIPQNNSGEKDEVMICAAGFGLVPYLDQWLMYQKTVGIKLIHINIDPSILQNLNKSSSEFVKVVVWRDNLNTTQAYYHSQSLKYQDCALRYQGIFKYMLVIGHIL